MSFVVGKFLFKELHMYYLIKKQAIYSLCTSCQFNFTYLYEDFICIHYNKHIIIHSINTCIIIKMYCKHRLQIRD